jgi:tRNA threonylcarbamoyladenosine biosynthesis protein TsaE
LGESQFQGPGLYLRNQLAAVELRTVERHEPIVETRLWQDEADTHAFAAALAAEPALGHAFIALHGDLGAGKTTLVRHLLQSLGVQGRIKSPTYAVVEPYELPQLNVWHFDFYRFADPREWEDAGFRDIFASPGLKLAEWPEKAAAVLPTADLDIHLQTQGETQRQVTLTARTPTGAALLQATHAEGPRP